MKGSETRGQRRQRRAVAAETGGLKEKHKGWSQRRMLDSVGKESQAREWKSELQGLCSIQWSGSEDSWLVETAC